MLQEYKEYLTNLNLPIKVASQPIYPIRSLDINAYLWGIVYTAIADETGQTPEEVHEGYKLKFRFRGDFVYNKQFDRYDYVIGTQSTTKADGLELWEYAMRVRADAEIEMFFIIPMPQEVFITDELNFDHEN